MRQSAKLSRVLLISAAFFTASAAHADPSGLRATALTGLERTDSAPGTGAQDGVYYGGQIGYDWDLGGLQAGFEGELGGSSARDPLVNTGARQGLFANAAVRVALPVTDRTRVFARGGYAYHEVTYTSAPKFAGSGYTLGGGGELDLGDRLLLRAEYRYSDYGNQVRGQHFVAGRGIRF